MSSGSAIVRGRFPTWRPSTPPSTKIRAGFCVTGAGEGAARAKQRTIVARDGKTLRADIWRLSELPAGRQLDGPAILAGPDATAFIEPGWGGVVHDSGAVILERA